MPAVFRFHVLFPFEVIQPCVDGPPFVTVPVGSVIETEEQIQGAGLVEIWMNKQPLLARMRDIEKYTKPFDEPACA